MKIRVYYEDTDIGGVVYYANYFKFIERARSELFFSSGMSPADGDEHFVVARVEADFIRSARFGDLLSVETRVVELKNASVILNQTVLKDTKRLFEATVRLAYTKAGRPTKIPDRIVRLLEFLSESE